VGEAAAAGRKRRRTALSWRGGAGRGARLPEDVLRPPLLSEMNSPLAYLAIVEVGKRLGSREMRERAMRCGEKWVDAVLIVVETSPAHRCLLGWAHSRWGARAGDSRCRR